MPTVIELFNRQIPLYGIFFYLGLVVAAVVAFFLAPKVLSDRWELVYSAVFTFIGAVIGSKLLFLLVTLRQIITEQIPLVAVIKGGFVFYGGLLGGALGLFCYTRLYRLKFSPYAALFATVLPLGHAIGRVGCFFGGCCYGKPYNGFFSHTYLTSSDASTPLGVPLFPVQLLESFCLLLLFVAMLTVFRSEIGKRPQRVYTVYLVLYALLRFFVEFLRGDRERGIFLGLSTSQWASIGILTIFLFYGLFSYFQKNRTERITKS